MDLINFLADLVKCKSVSPANDGAIEIVSDFLEKLGFNCNKLSFFDSSQSVYVTNLYAELGVGSRNLCFAGHTDVVPPGDEKLWRSPPFELDVSNEICYGRGIVDMKGAIAAFAFATSEFLAEVKSFDGKISFLISGNEEDDPTFGMISLLDWVKKNKISISDCIVGEPTSESQVGDVVKIGRRGSIDFRLVIYGKQGHVAYPHNAINPINIAAKLIAELKSIVLDEGNKTFQRSNLEFTNIDVGNLASNVIPDSVVLNFNIRFNNLWSKEQLVNFINENISKIADNYKLDYKSSSDAFITNNGELSELALSAIFDVNGVKARKTTDGGTSDARFIKDLCPVIELGLCNKTAHKTDENSPIADLLMLKQIYKNFLHKYFAS